MALKTCGHDLRLRRLAEQANERIQKRDAGGNYYLRKKASYDATPARRRMTIVAVVAAIVGVSSSFLQARSLNIPLLREVGEISRNLDNAQRLATYVWLLRGESVRRRCFHHVTWDVLMNLERSARDRAQVLPSTPVVARESTVIIRNEMKIAIT